ncbi:unnamed protein product [Sphagnum jensenii]|uniref:Uncharacterized protein n=1 Tax=Sphagnum jensenii TaxID=128206 RepID=A0ABP1AMQ0_9BRYO
MAAAAASVFCSSVPCGVACSNKVVVVHSGILSRRRASGGDVSSSKRRLQLLLGFRAIRVRVLLRGGGLKRRDVYHSNVGLGGEILSGFRHGEARRKQSGLGCLVVAAASRGSRAVVEELREIETTESSSDQGDRTSNVHQNEEAEDAMNSVSSDTTNSGSKFLGFQDLKSKGGKAWNNFIQWHVLYRNDIATWGVGTNPIFFLEENSDGSLKVSIDDAEIERRSGIGPFFAKDGDSETNALFAERTAQAQKLAEDIEAGLVKPSKASSIFKWQSSQDVITGPKEALVNVYNAVFTSEGGGVYNRVSSVVAKTPPVVKFSLLGFMVFYGICLVWAARIFFSKEKQEAAKKDYETDLRVRKLEMMKAEMNQAAGPVGSGKPSAKEDQFRKRIQEIQSMARAARLSEQRDIAARASSVGVDKGPVRIITGSGHLSQKSLNRLTGVPDNNADSEIEDGISPNRLPASGAGEVLKTESIEDGRARNNGEVAIPEGEIGMPSSGKADDESHEDQISFNRDAKVVAPQVLDEVIPLKKDEAVKSPINGSVRVSLTKAPSPTDTSPVANGRVNGGAPPSQPLGVKPLRVILSPEEARARIEAKKAKEAKEGTSSVSDISKNNSNYFRPRRIVVKPQEEVGEVGVSETQPLAELPKADAEGDKASPGELGEKSGGVSIADVPESDVLRIVADEDVNSQHDGMGEGPENGELKETQEKNAKEEEQEEQEWMRDEVLKAIVFKVRDNEQAGRESFHGLDSKEEMLFFKGLERKFEREGEMVKTWIQERVENLDYGHDGISIDDPPEMYMARWKDQEPGEMAGNANRLSQFKEDRKRIIEQQMGVSSSSPHASAPPPPVSPSPPKPVSSSPPKPPQGKDPTAKARPQSERGHSGERTAVNGTKTLVSSSGRQKKPEAEQMPNSKKWTQDLQRKYEMERDPEQRALMREFGQDLEKWITDGEIQEAQYLLSKGAEGEQEYARRHYEKIKAKIREQQERFGEQAMLEKYSEYKPTKKEADLWWLDLPYVLCIGVRSKSESKEEGLYSLNMTPDFEGITGTKSETKYHTVAFQDRKDAVNFCSLLLSQPDKFVADSAEVVPLSPKDLYQEAKEEGFKVTVLKKGQLKLVPGQPLEDVEQRIIEIGSSVYWEELERERSIDIDAVLDDGFGYGGQKSSFPS